MPSTNRGRILTRTAVALFTAGIIVATAPPATAGYIEMDRCIRNGGSFAHCCIDHGGHYTYDPALKPPAHCVIAITIEPARAPDMTTVFPSPVSQAPVRPQAPDQGKSPVVPPPVVPGNRG